jgi:hypothetical protein
MITTYALLDKNAELVTIYTSDAILVDRVYTRKLQRHIPLREAIQDHLDVIGEGHTLFALITGTYGCGADWVVEERHIGFDYSDGTTTIDSLLRHADGVTENQLNDLHAVVTYALLLASDHTARMPLY